MMMMKFSVQREVVMPILYRFSSFPFILSAFCVVVVVVVVVCLRFFIMIR